MTKQTKGVKLINYLVKGTPISEMISTIGDKLWNMTDEDFDEMIKKVNKK